MLIVLLAAVLTVAFPFILLAVIGVLYTLTAGLGLKLVAGRKELQP